MRTKGIFTTVGVAAALALVAPSAAQAGHPEGEVALGPARAVATEPSAGRSALGRFSKPFSERRIGGRRANTNCITYDDGAVHCKPAAGSLAILPSGKILYWNALEGTERVEASVVTDYGSVALNDQSRLLKLRGKRKPRWRLPTPVDGGANPDGLDDGALIPGGNGIADNDGALFCSDLVFLPDGRVLAAGGSAYYNDPEVPGTGIGVVEIEGLKNSRIYDPETNSWTQTGQMNFSRWYPSLVTLGNGDVFAASGVEKLLKPIYVDRPLESGTNITQTETLDVSRGVWNDNGSDARRSLPLYPRLRLLPNGHVYYDAAGQSFNPSGQSYDMLLWNLAASYDPEERSWKTLGIPGLDALDPAGLSKLEIGKEVSDVLNLGAPGLGSGLTVPGFRGSTFSAMLPLEPDRDGAYTKARFLTAGGVIGLATPSPGSYFTTSDSRIVTVDTSGETSISTEPTGDLSQPRWYATSVLLPTGEVVAFSGSDRDHVVGPGVEYPIKQAEIFDPESERWTPLASARRPRTYHNTAALLPSGKVLVGGHAPLTTLYLKHLTLPGGFAPNDGRDPSFEIYKPPNLFRGRRPRIKSVASRPGYGEAVQVKLKRQKAKRIESVVLVRNPAVTHVVDGDQRAIELPILGLRGNQVTVKMPPDANVAPPGPYMLFANGRTPDGPTPSRAAQLTLGG